MTTKSILEHINDGRVLGSNTMILQTVKVFSSLLTTAMMMPSTVNPRKLGMLPILVFNNLFIL